ncbi:MAG: PDZ domain-containing protein, partial [candidate division KSB1 bacterium]|nr:PDZ domain-containing protein [candidate division KSB1 bacterium]
KAGLKASDVILEIDGVPAENKDQVSARIASTPPGTKVTLTVLRRGSTRRVEVTLGTLPEEETTTPRIAEKSSTKLGFAVQNLTNELAARYGYQGQEGVLVTDVERGSVAASAGLQPGQLIKEVNQVPVRTVRDLEQELDKLGPGDPLLLRVYYQKRNLFIAMQIPEE